MCGISRAFVTKAIDLLDSFLYLNRRTQDFIMHSSMGIGSFIKFKCWLSRCEQNDKQIYSPETPYYPSANKRVSN